MTFTNAQKQKRYRENLKAKDLYQAIKVKHAARMRTYRQNLTGKAKEDYNKRHAELQRVYGNKNKKSTYVLYYLLVLHKNFPHL